MESAPDPDNPEPAKPFSLDLLRHPIRVRIIEACTDFGLLSPAQMVHWGLCADVESVKGKTGKQQLSHIAYHCRRLRTAGLLSLVAERPARGATEHFYRANSEAFFSDDEWAKLDKVQRSGVSRVVWQRFIAQVEASMQEETFDDRKDRWMAWGPLELDERGWEELMTTVAGCYAEIEKIRRKAEPRIKESEMDPIRSTYALFGFESPPRRDMKRKRSSPDDR